MKHRLTRYVFGLGLLLMSGQVLAQEPVEAADTMVYQLSPGPLITSKIRLLTRSYGDRVVLRWMPEDYVSWKFLRYYGVNVLRVRQGTMDIDTLAYALKPLSMEQLQDKYPTTDQQAMVAMGMLYGEGRLDANHALEPPGTMGANVEYNNEQDLSFAYAMLVAEWRPDLAEAMAVGFTDRKVKKGDVYDYYVQVSQWELGGKIIFEPGVNEGVEVKGYKPEPYDPIVMDTLTAPRRVAISWIDTEHSSYEIDRREKGQKEWTRLNDKPYLSMVDAEDIKGLTVYSDSVDHNGTWEYRVMAHDAFGELTPPSPIHTAFIRDIEPPKPPVLTRIVIERPDDNDPAARILAHVHWTLAEPLDDDLQGYVIQYHNSGLTGDAWQPISEQMAAPRDTVATVDVTMLRTGMICVSAYDDSGNESRSLPQVIRITDMRPPLAPDSLQASVLTDGHVILVWEPHAADDDISYYDLAFANDSTHEFLLRNEGGIIDPMFVDSLQTNVNQKYIYYKVRATDYSGNIGAWSKVLRVLRPHDTAPTKPHLDVSSHDDRGMHMRWVVGTDADMDYHLLLRRQGSDGEWQVVARWDADSIASTGQYAVSVDDNPSYHQDKRYYYMVESHNTSPYTSQSLAVSWLHQGPHFFDISIRLIGDYIERDRQVKLVWDVATLPVKDVPYYFCVFRKGAQDKRFKYLYNVMPENPEFIDRSLQPGEEAQYYVSIRFRDGRESNPSNIVSIKRNSK